MADVVEFKLNSPKATLRKKDQLSVQEHTNIAVSLMKIRRTVRQYPLQYNKTHPMTQKAKKADKWALELYELMQSLMINQRPDQADVYRQIRLSGVEFAAPGDASDLPWLLADVTALICAGRVPNHEIRCVAKMAGHVMDLVKLAKG